jgi:glutamine cyclotransferase
MKTEYHDNEIYTSGSLDAGLSVVDESFGDVGFSRLLRVDFTDTAETMEPILNVRSRFGVSGVVGSVRSS